jgi:predicted nucleic acid-binding protein
VIILVDTNVICRLCNTVKPATPDAIAAKKALRVLRDRGYVLSIVPQNLYEFWSVATRAQGGAPAGANGLGMSVERADSWIGYVLRNFKLLADGGKPLALWRDIVRTYRVTGHKCHDAHLAAVMQSHGIVQILTFNGDDFKRFPHLTILDPRTIS